MREIGGFFTSFLNLCIQGFTFAYNTLDSITIYGVSLLSILFSFFIIGSLISVVMTMAPNGLVNTVSIVDRKIRNKRERNSNND